MMWATGLFAGFVVAVPAYGLWRRKPVLQQLQAGVLESARILIRLAPYVVLMLLAISMMRASGVFELVAGWLAPSLQKMGIPVDLVPLALARPFAGSSANAIFADIVHTHGGNAFVSQAAATMLGSTETTFYVLAIYFGSVGIKKIRYALWAGLLADLAGLWAACFFCHYLL